jgi:hypothetical protein
VIRGGTRLILAFAAVALVALLLAACGSSDSDDSASSSTTVENGGPGGTQEQGEGSSEGEGQSGAEKGVKEFTEAEVSVPLKVSGGGSDQFIVKGGDNSIQEFGEESDESELEEAAVAVHDFYVTRASGAWADACSRISASLREQLEQLATKSSNVKGCAAFLEAFTTALSAAAWREVTTMDAASLRREGDQGFLIYEGAANTVYAMPLKEEDGEWKVTALSATALSS